MSLGGRPSVRRRMERVVAVATEHIVPGDAGIHYLRICHDDDCPSLRTQSLMDCTCDPEIRPPVRVHDVEELVECYRETRR